MSDPQTSEEAPAHVSPEAMRSALFAQMVLQQSSLAMMLLGKTPHPETGKVIRDLEGARLFIDQLEMLEFKTKGNLNPDEAALLKQSLMSLRLAFVESVDTAPPPDQAPAGTEPKPPVATPSAPSEEEHRKKFSKKY
jgi:Domain of unknown function (DUF1844)